MNRLKENIHPLLKESAISALAQQNIFTVKDFVFCDTQSLAKISLLLFKEILEIKRHFIKIYSANTENAYDIYISSLENSAIISSGIERVDNFLEGGLLTSNIYEICGKAGSGKSLLAYTFMKNLVFEMNQNCFLLDTKNDFSAEKFILLCKKFSGEAFSNNLSRIFIKSIETKYDLLNSLSEIVEKFENNFAAKLIVIDSLATLFLGEKDHSQNNLLLSHICNTIHLIANKYQVVVLVINLITSWVEGDFTVHSNTTNTISCGRFWYTVPNTRLKLENDGTNFKLEVEKSNLLPLGKEAVISLKTLLL